VHADRGLASLVDVGWKAGLMIARAKRSEEIIVCRRCAPRMSGRYRTRATRL